MKTEDELYWWLSFADDVTGQNLGVVMTTAPDFDAALSKTNHLSINPGGEVRAWEMDGTHEMITDDLLNRLIQKPELKRLNFI